MCTWPAIIDSSCSFIWFASNDFRNRLRILRALRMLRLLKFSRYFKVMNLLLGVLKERQSFLAAMFLLTIAMLILQLAYTSLKKMLSQINSVQYLKRCGGQ